MSASRAGSTRDAAAALRRSGLLAAFLYALGAGYMALTAGQLSSERAGERIWVGALTAAVTALVLVLLPWRRMPPWTSLLPPLWAFVVLAVPIGWYAHALSDYLLLYTLLFLYVGLTQRQGTCLALLPLALLTLLSAADDPQLPPLTLLLSPVLVAVILGEVLAFLVGQQRRAQSHLDRLLAATAQLQASRTTREAAATITSLAQELFGADGATVLLREGRDGSVLAEVGSPGGIRIDTAREDSGSLRALRAGEPLFVADARSDGGLHRATVERLGVRSALFLPLGAHGAYEGVAVAWFCEPRRRIDLAAQRTAQVLATQAGEVLRRVHEAEALEDLAHTDSLTGLPNRRALFGRLASTGPRDCLVFVDLDHFKQVNDSLGHSEGDGVLRSFGATLARGLREQDLAARYGGEEFALVLPGTEVDGALDVLARLRRSWSAERPGLTFSAGVAVHGSRSATETLAAADAALYEAKRAGRDTVRVADPLGADAPGTVLRLERRQRLG